MVETIELRITRLATGYYIVTKVYPGIANIVYVQRKFASFADTTKWCKTEYPNVPRIRD